MSKWQVELLGQLRVRCEGKTVDHFLTQKAAALLAYVALYPQRNHPRDRLVEALWPEDLDATTLRARLSYSLWALRKQLESKDPSAQRIFIATPNSIRLNNAQVIVDAELFESKAESAFRSVDLDLRQSLLTEAFHVYKGELLPGFHDDWVVIERHRLEDKYAQVVHALIASHQSLGQLTTALDVARKALSTNSCDEALHQAVMSLYLELNDPSATVRQYEELEGILRSQLGMSPSPQARELVDQAKKLATQRCHPRDASVESLPLDHEPQLGYAPVHLPPQYTRFFGREDELKDLGELLVDSHRRLLTLLGLAGCGKTRLSIELANRFRHHFNGGVWFVPLMEARCSDDIWEFMLRSLSVKSSGTGSAHQSLLTWLKKRAERGRILLILDNFEHLADEGALLVRKVLDSVPNLHIIITSRHHLALEGEWEHLVQPLDVPRISPLSGGASEEVFSSASVHLFVDRAQQIRPQFKATPENALMIAKLCARLEGIPLAIELAAAWVKTLGLSEILDQLDRRFDVLVSHRKDIEPRHRTLRAALDYGYEMLPNDLQELFAALSIFKGGWNLSAVSAICTQKTSVETGSLLQQLMDRSLIFSGENVYGKTGYIRFQMLDTVSEYAAEKLKPTDRERYERAHNEFYLSLVLEAVEQAQSSGQVVSYRLIEDENENIDLVLHRFRQGMRWQEGLQLAMALYPFWQVRGCFAEARRWLTMFTEMPGNTGIPPLLRATALAHLGKAAYCQFDLSSAEQAFRESLELRREANDAAAVASSLSDLAIVRLMDQDFASAKELLEQSLVVAEQAGDEELVGRCYNNLGNICRELKDLPSASHYYARSVHTFRSMGNLRHVAVPLNNLGVVAYRSGDYGSARRFYEQALEMRQSIGDRPGMAVSYQSLGEICAFQGDFQRSGAYFKESLLYTGEIEDLFFLSTTLAALAKIFVFIGDKTLGLRLYAASEAVRRQEGFSSFVNEGPEQSEAWMTELVDTFGHERFAAEIELAGGISFKDRILSALEIVGVLDQAKLAS